MNKPINKEFATRVNKCVFEMKNSQHYYETTGMHFSTVQRILDRGWADEDQMKKLEDYCDAVEGVTKEDQAA